jgi:hypothetical protein
MAQCAIGIHLEKDGVTYAPGEAVRGEVRVTPGSDSDVDCRRLALTFRWRVHGKTWMEGPATTSELFRGTWIAGTAYTYPFELVAPPGPATYHGTLFSVDHYITAEADLAPAGVEVTLPEAEILLPPADATKYDFGSMYEPGSLGRVSQPGIPFSWWILSPFILTCGGFAFVEHVALGVVFAAFVLSIVIVTARRRRAVERLGRPFVTPKPDPVHAGGELAVQVDVSPRSAVKLVEARARLIGRERAAFRTGTDIRMHTREIHTGGWIALAGDAEGDPDRPMVLHGTLVVPKYAAPTFMTADSEVTWRVQASLQAEGSPEWQGDCGVTVMGPTSPEPPRSS